MSWSGQADCGRHRRSDRSAAIRRAVGGWALALAAIAGGLGGIDALPAAEARTRQDPGVVALQTLPPQARQTYRLIRSGGPFPYQKDGSVFFNRERLLPAKTRGYWREYTVATPGARDRGARRIVCGGESPTVPDACFYTADHYASFDRIADVDAR